MINLPCVLVSPLCWCSVRHRCWSAWRGQNNQANRIWRSYNPNTISCPLTEESYFTILACFKLYLLSSYYTLTCVTTNVRWMASFPRERSIGCSSVCLCCGFVKTFFLLFHSFPFFQSVQLKDLWSLSQFTIKKRYVLSSSLSLGGLVHSKVVLF